VTPARIQIVFACFLTYLLKCLNLKAKKLHDDISNGTGIVVSTNIRTNTQTDTIENNTTLTV